MKGDVIGVGLLAGSIVVLTLFYPYVIDAVSTREPELSAYSDDWNDLSRFREALEEEGFETHGIVATPGILREVEEPERTLLIIVGVETAYNYRDTQTIVDFIEAGGSLILADDYGFADDLAREFGVSYYRHDLWDPNFITNTSFLNITVTLPDDNGDPRPYNVLFNKPTAIDSKDQGTPLGMTTNESFLDTNANGMIDVKDVQGPFEVVTLKGRMVFIGDPSIFINEMWGRLENREFAISLVRFLLPEGGLVLFDESVHAPRDFMEGFYRTVAATIVFVFGEMWTGLLVTAGITAEAIVASRVVRDPKLWHHHLGLGDRVHGNLHFMETSFRGKRKELMERLRSDAYDLISVRSGMRPEEFAALPARRLRSIVADDALFRFLRGADMGPREVFERLERWL